MSEVKLLDRVFEPLAEALTPDSAQRIIDWRADEETQRQLDELGDKAREGSLSPTERRNYETCVRVIDFIGILQAKARAMMTRRADSH
jgi:hypothetical protein